MTPTSPVTAELDGLRARVRATVASRADVEKRMRAARDGVDALGERLAALAAKDVDQFGEDGLPRPRTAAARLVAEQREAVERLRTTWPRLVQGADARVLNAPSP